MAKKDAAKETPAAKGKKKSGLVKILVWSFVGILLMAGSAGGALFMTGGLDPLLAGGGDTSQAEARTVQAQPSQSAAPAAPARPAAPPIYLPLDPPFVVNFEDQGMLRYLQISISVMGRDQTVMDSVTSHSPQIRNDLIVLLGNQDFSTLNSAEGKENLRQKALETIQAILKRELGTPGIEAVYFTNFVMQ